MRMAVIVLLAVFSTSASAKEPNPAAAATTEEIEFYYAVSFHNETLILLTKLPTGKVHCSVLTRPEETDVPAKNTWEKLKEFQIPASTFEQLSEALEQSELHIAATRAGETGSDGTTWKFRKKAGGREIRLSFWAPEITPRARSSALVIELGNRFAATAAMMDLLAPKKK